MRRMLLASFILISGLNLFAHAGEVHKYMGTVSAVHENGSFMLKKTDGSTMHIEVAKKTAFRFLDGKPAKPSDLATGRRIAVTISEDGKTASEVRIGAKK